jgi:hypothetical protein
MHAGRRRRPRDTGVPHLDRPAAQPGGLGEETGAAAAQLVGVHSDMDAGRATLQAAWPKALAQSPTSLLRA